MCRTLFMEFPLILDLSSSLLKYRTTTTTTTETFLRSKCELLEIRKKTLGRPTPTQASTLHYTLPHEDHGEVTKETHQKKPRHYRPPRVFAPCRRMHVLSPRKVHESMRRRKRAINLHPDHVQERTVRPTGLRPLPSHRRRRQGALTRLPLPGKKSTLQQ